MSGKDSWLRKRFRDAEAPRNREATHVLGQLRASGQCSEYATIFSAFRIAAPKTFRLLLGPGPRSAAELVWIRAALPPLTLENELRWAECWLSGQFGRINAFRDFAAHLQKLVLAGELATARRWLDDHVRGSGWSLWAVELRVALVQLTDGTTAQRQWLGDLQAHAVNSIPGLLFQIFGDRNDDTYSYEAIYSKCMNSFPRYESVAPWLVDYLKHRALSHISDPAKALPAILSRDITSSVIDYYEDVIEALTLVGADDDIAACRPAATKLVASLLRSGHKDSRLRKLAYALEAEIPNDIKIYSKPDDSCQAVYLGSPDPLGSQLPADVAKSLAACQAEGAAAHDQVGQTVKWGLNLRGLDIGPAVAIAAYQSTSNILRQRVLPMSTMLLSDSFSIHDAAALSSDGGLRLLNQYQIQNKRKRLDAASLLKPSSWSFRDVLPVTGPAHLWLARQLLEAKQFTQLDELKAFLREKSKYWERQCAKLDVQALSMQGNLDDAIAILQVWLQKDSRYALEFPTDSVFAERKWAHFRDLDPVNVGLVAHYAFEANGEANVGYICKMACRKFLCTRMRDSIFEIHESASPERKAQLTDFLRDVWIEQNLAMCHDFESTAQVRDERMRVLQLLLGWDVERATEYTDAIKDLTLDQTLQRGLERIDQTRVFVNESAITRWAEKELGQDYDRWRKLSESSLGGRTVDDMLRQYVVDSTNVDILKEFANGKPTAADALLIDVIDRLFKRFLLDPTDGLDTYLSVRIRHGSLRGTVLGPLEEQGLLYSATGFSQQAFESRWDGALRLPVTEREKLLAIMHSFSNDIRQLVDGFVDQRVHVQRLDKPNGAFPQVMSPLVGKILAASLAERPQSFHAFLGGAYFVFWKLVEAGLSDLRKDVIESLAPALHDRVDTLIHDLRARGPKYLPLITTLTTASTMTKSQCDTVAEWFQLPRTVAGELYQLPDAIEIASLATKNVHRAFPAKVRIASLPAVPLPLTPSGLAVLMDCLFVAFENAWKHSGLAPDLQDIELDAEFEPATRLLTLVIRNALSPERCRELIHGGLNSLRTKYLGDLPLELISREGGSGFPKLARLTSSVPRDCCPKPFEFGIEGGRWYTKLTVPLYEREGAFEAYE